MKAKTFEYNAVIQFAGKGGAFVPFPYDVRSWFSKGRVKVYATFDGEPYEGSVVNMGVKNADGTSVTSSASARISGLNWEAGRRYN